MENLPVETFECVASFLPPEDFGSLRLANKAAANSLAYSLKLRVGPSKRILHPDEEALTRFVEANQGPYMDRITTLQITEDGLIETLQNVADDLDRVKGSLAEGFAKIFATFPNLKTVVYIMSDSRDWSWEFMEREEPFALEILAEAIKGFKLKVHVASPHWDFVVFWDKNMARTQKFRLVGGRDFPRRSLFKQLSLESQGRLSVDLSDVIENLCSFATATHLSSFSFAAFNHIAAAEWDVFAFDVFVSNPTTLLVDNCIVGTTLPWDSIVQNKIKLGIRDCYVAENTLVEILDYAADPAATPDLQQLWIEDIAFTVFEWTDKPGIYNNGSRLQEFIALEGLREACRRARNCMRVLKPNEVGSTSNLVSHWQQDPAERQIGFQQMDQHFQANFRR